MLLRFNCSFNICSSFQIYLFLKGNAPYNSQWFSKFPPRGGERSERSEQSDQALLSISELSQTPSMFYLALHDRYKLNALPVPLLRQVYVGVQKL